MTGIAQNASILPHQFHCFSKIFEISANIQGSKLAGVRESAAPRFLEGLLDFNWQGVRMTPKIKRGTVPEPLKIQKWQTPI